MQQVKETVNKDLILRENLAIERTVMANDRTFLSFVRTSLYFVVAGFTLDQVVDIRYGATIAIFCFVTGALLFLAGLYKYLHLRKKIRISRQKIGNYLADMNGDGSGR